MSYTGASATELADEAEAHARRAIYFVAATYEDTGDVEAEAAMADACAVTLNTLWPDHTTEAARAVRACAWAWLAAGDLHGADVAFSESDEWVA